MMKNLVTKTLIFEVPFNSYPFLFSGNLFGCVSRCHTTRERRQANHFSSVVQRRRHRQIFEVRDPVTGLNVKVRKFPRIFLSLKTLQQASLYWIIWSLLKHMGLVRQQNILSAWLSCYVYKNTSYLYLTGDEKGLFRKANTILLSCLSVLSTK